MMEADCKGGLSQGFFVFCFFFDEKVLSLKPG